MTARPQAAPLRRRPPVWLGLVLGLAALATMLVSLGFAYFHLAFHASRWPPDGFARPGLAAPGVGLAVLVLSAVPMVLARRAIDAGRQRETRLGLAAAAVLGATVLAVQVLGYRRLGFAAADHAYASLFVTLSAFHTLSLVTAVVFSLVTQARAWLGHFSAEYHEGIRLAALWWYWAVVSGVVVFAILFLGPYIDVEPGP